MDRAFVLLFRCAGDKFDQCFFDKSVYTRYSFKDCLMISGSIKDGARGRLIRDFDTGTNSSLNRSLAIGFSSKYILGV